MKHRNLTFVLMAMLACSVSAQNNNSRDDFFGKNSDGFAEARKKMYEDFNDFRKQCLKEYSDFVRKAWKDYKAEPAREAPEEKEVAPMMAPGADAQTASWFGKLFKKKKNDKSQASQPKPAAKKPENRKSEVFEVKDVITPAPTFEQPQPIAEVKEVSRSSNPYMTFSVFGTQCKVRIGEDCRFTLRSLSSNTVADVIEKFFSKPQFDNLLYP